MLKNISLSYVVEACSCSHFWGPCPFKISPFLCLNYVPLLLCLSEAFHSSGVHALGSLESQGSGSRGAVLSSFVRH